VKITLVKNGPFHLAGEKRYSVLCINVLRLRNLSNGRDIVFTLTSTHTSPMRKAIHIDCAETGHFNNIREAALIANLVLRNEAFYRSIAAIPSFDHCDTSPAIIARLLSEAAFTMTLNLYYSLSPIRNIDGYDDEENPFNVHINVWKTDRSPESMCNTMIHACVHALNACHPQYYFGHGDNTLQGKHNSAPYRIGAIAQTMVSNDEPVIIPLEHDPYEPRISTIKKQFANPQFMLAK